MESADETVASIRWVSLKTDGPTNAVAPGTSVTIEVDPGLGIAPTYVEVRRHPGRIFMQLAARLSRSPAVAPVYLSRVGPRGKGGGWWRYESYTAEHLPPPERGTQYVGSAGGKRTGFLSVGFPVAFDTEHSLSANAGFGVDVPGIGAPEVGVERMRTNRRQITITAPADPGIRIELLTEERPTEYTTLGMFFGSYVEKMFSELLGDETGNEFRRAYYNEFQPAYVYSGGEAASVQLDETELHLDAGETREVTLTFEPNYPGTMGLAVVATDVETGAFSVSDLMGITVEENGEIIQDF